MKTISKSSFIRGTKCPKSLWLHFFQPEERDEISEGQQNIFDTGHDVGIWAQKLFPDGIDASRGEHEKVSEAIEYTQELIKNGQTVIYEAAFGDGETLCYMDILVKENGEWRAYEVKASTGIKDYHKMDAAFQYYVITHSGLPLADIFLVHINNQYVRHGDIDVKQLFTIVPVTNIILPMQETIPGQLMSLQEMLDAGIIPGIEMGFQCTHPYNCDFIDFCTTHHALDPIPDTHTSSPAKAGSPLRSDIQHLVSSIRDQDKLNEFTNALEYPLYFMDFETIFPAIPLHDESRPYQQIPFQYSLHIVQSSEVAKKRSSEIIQHPASSIQHHYFLGSPPADPRPEFIKSLLANLGTYGSIIVWNQGFEMNRLREIARDFPEYQVQIEELLERVVDLMVPFRKKYLYSPDMNGSYSLKAVLPALVSDLSYSDLKIQEGGTASMTYESLYYDTDPESVAKKMEDLLRYCEMDTLSMVRILEKI